MSNSKLLPEELRRSIPKYAGYGEPADATIYARYILPDGTEYHVLDFDGEDYFQGFEVAPRSAGTFFMRSRKYTGFLLSELEYQGARLDKKFRPKKA